MTVDASVGLGIANILFDKDNEKICRRTFRRHFKRDGYRMYSAHAKRSDVKSVVSATTGEDWIEKFTNRDSKYKHYDF